MDVVKENIARDYPRCDPNDMTILYYAITCNFCSADADDESQVFVAVPGNSPLLEWQDGRLVYHSDFRDLNGKPVPIPEIYDTSAVEKVF